MSDEQSILAERVTASLKRIGFQYVRVVDLGEGRIQIESESLSPEDKLLVRQAARAVSGVSEVIHVS